MYFNLLEVRLLLLEVPIPRIHPSNDNNIHTHGV